MVKKNGIHFAFFGDWGNGNPGQIKVAEAVRSAYSDDTIQFVCGLGDNFYPSGVNSGNLNKEVQDKFSKVYSEIPTQFYMCLGNHDYYGNPGLQLGISDLDQRWILPNYYYDFTVKSDSGVKAHYIVFDSNHTEYSAWKWSVQKRWMKKQLRRTRDRVHWTILICHHPWKSTGSHGNGKGRLKKLFDELTSEFPIDFVLSGHDHDMQLLEAGQGTHQIVTGTGSVVRRNHHRDINRPGLKFYAESLGYGKLSLFKPAAHFTFLDTDNESIFSTRFSPKSKLVLNNKRRLQHTQRINRKKSLQ